MVMDVIEALDRWLASGTHGFDTLVQRARDEIVALRELGPYVADALNAAQQARAEALEEAARVCDERAMTGTNITNQTAHSLAAAIRALKDKANG
jgi:hypothetical protein